MNTTSSIASTSTSQQGAVRQHGVCHGTLTLQCVSVREGSGGQPPQQPQGDYDSHYKPLSSLVYPRWQQKHPPYPLFHAYCVLTGVHLRCYEHKMAYMRSDACTHSLSLVGGSAWQPPKKLKRGPLSGSNHHSNHAQSVVVLSTTTMFRLVSEQGHHYVCHAPTPNCRALWLSALHAGLELAWRNNTQEFEEEEEKQQEQKTHPPQQHPPPNQNTKKEQEEGVSPETTSDTTGTSSPTNTHSVAAAVSSSITRLFTMIPNHNNHHHNHPSKPNIITTTYHNHELRRRLPPSVSDCSIAHGLLDHVQFVSELMNYHAAQHAQMRAALQLLLLNHHHRHHHDNTQSNHVKKNHRTRRRRRRRFMMTSDDSVVTSEPSLQSEDDANDEENDSSNNNRQDEEPEKVDDEVVAALESSSLSDAVHTPPRLQVPGNENTESQCRSITPSPSPPPPSSSSSSSSSPLLSPDRDPDPSTITTASSSTSMISMQTLLYTLESDAYSALARSCPQLEEWKASVVEERSMDVSDFMEHVHEAMGLQCSHRTQLKQEATLVSLSLVVSSSSSASASSSSSSSSSPSSSSSSTDTQNDHHILTLSGSALQCLADHALQDDGEPQLLRCILNFFLDTLMDKNHHHHMERDEPYQHYHASSSTANSSSSEVLSSIAFFWPQLCHIHLRMLPPKHGKDLIKIEMMEDFLLTIAARYSIHLALELVWSHRADLEESLWFQQQQSQSQHQQSYHNSSNSSSSSITGSSTCAPAARWRRFAVLRFLCELESLLFDDQTDAWGGGSVSLGKLLQPTAHQAELLKQTMECIQHQRLQHPTTYRLTRSFWTETRSISKRHPDRPVDHHAVQEKLRIAQNAEYFSSHLNFTQRLCDTAEKLRHMDIERRGAALMEELVLLNASGAMGGDPLNRLQHDRHSSLTRVVRVPPAEGHVFRSKERTPVLLLMEVVHEGAHADDVLLLLPRDSSPTESSISARNSHDATVNDTDEKGSREDPSQNVVAEDASHENGGSELIAATNHHDTGSEEPTPFLPSKPKFPIRSHSTSAGSLDLEGSYCDKPSPRVSGLKILGGDSDSSEKPTTPKKQVELLVSSAMKHENIILLPSLAAVSDDRDNKNTRTRDSVGDSIIDVHKSVSELNLSDLLQDEHKEFHESPSTAGIIPGVHMPEPPCEATLRVRETHDTRIHSSKLSSLSSSLQSGPRREGKDRLEKRISKKSLTLGSLTGSFRGGDMDSIDLAPTGDVRRAVLTAIMMRGIQGKDSIAIGAADSVQRSLKELERRRATELLFNGSAVLVSEHEETRTYTELVHTKDKLVSLGIGSISKTDSFDEDVRIVCTEEDEAMEAIRLLLIQNRVAQGQLSEADAALVLQHTSLSNLNSSALSPRSRRKPLKSFDHSEMPTIDAGDVDSRLVGCGALPPAILQALTLWKAEMVNTAELLELIKKDLEFLRHSVLHDAENQEKLKEDSAFWGRFAFGERWAEKKSRIAASSPEGSVPGWDLVGVIVKSNDDLRQESFVMQLIELCQEAFTIAGLELWVNPYRILATGRTTGVIEMVRNAMSFDALKKRPGYGKGGLREHLHRMTEFTADPGNAFKSAQQNFVRSLAAYSLLSYLFQFKDRHNGNLLLDTAGHVIHIDFGFVFGIAPGGSFSLEMSTPFKLTEEMMDVMGGLKSPLFSEFVTLFCCGLLALQPYTDTFLTMVDIMCTNSTFKCFENNGSQSHSHQQQQQHYQQASDVIVSKLRERFSPDLTKEETVCYALDLIRQALTSYGTKQYDMFQYLSQGIAT